MSLKVCYWNINGLNKEKYEEEEFVNTINKYDIICLTETWQDKQTNESTGKTPYGYKEIKYTRKGKRKRAKRNSGGILILYRSTLQEFIKVQNQNDQNIIWLKIDKCIVGLDKDLLLGTVYISPKYSRVYNSDAGNNDTFLTLYNQIASFGENKPLVVGGDFNARTGNLKDTLISERNEEKYIKMPESPNKKTNAPGRINQDKKTNDFGHELRELCVSTGMNILNGRTIGDLLGKYTYIGHNGCSTVGYILASDNLYCTKNAINRFQVKDLTRFSDHLPITISLNGNPQNESQNRKNNEIKGEIRNRTKAFPFNKTSFENRINSDKLNNTANQILKMLSAEKKGQNLGIAIKQIEKLMTEANQSSNASNQNIIKVGKQRYKAKKNRKNSGMTLAVAL